MPDFERDKFKIEIKHWTGTIVVAVVAVFVILGLLKGQQILGNFLNRKASQNLEKGERSQISDQITGLGLNIIPSVSPLPSILSTPVLTVIITPTPKSTLTSSPTPAPTKTHTPAFSSTPALTLTPTPNPASSLSPTPLYTPTSTPVYSPSPTPSPTPSPSPSPAPTPESILPVVINEIAWMGTTADATDEWIELYNPNSFVVDITGWTIKAFKIKNGVLAADTPDITFPEKTIGAFGYFLLERTSDNTVLDVSADLIYTGALDNSGEILELRDNVGQLKDTVGQKDSSGQIVIWYSGDNTTKSSMERKSSNTSGTDQNNWQTNNGTTKNGQDSVGNPIKGTPKNPNS